MDIKALPDWLAEKLASKRPHAERGPAADVELDTDAAIQRATELLQRYATSLREVGRNGKQINGPAIEKEGGDNWTLQVAMNVGDLGISPEMCLELMLDHFNPHCIPNWSVEELEKKVRSAYNSREKPPGSDTADAEFAGDDFDPADIPDSIMGNQGARTPPPTRRPDVNMLPSRLHEAMDQTQYILLKQANRHLNKSGGSTAADQIFQRNGKLVKLSRNLHRKPKGDKADTKVVDGVTVDSHYQELNALTINEVRPPWLTTRLTRAIEFHGPSAGKPPPGKPVKMVPKDVKPNLVMQLISDDSSWEFPALFAPIEAPTLRPDGSILSEPGYDPSTGMFLDPGTVKFPKIKPEPTEAAGRAAIKRIDDEILHDFPFVDPPGYEGVSQAVAMAMMLTGPVRRGLPTAPAFAADSNEPESGKSMLLKSAAALMTGREIAGKPFSDNEEERRKSIGTAFLEARPALFFDNVDCVIEGASLEMALTTPLFDDRRLGAHEGFLAPTNSLVLFSGNHIQVGGTGMSTRILVSRLVPTKTLAERLAEKAYKHPFLIKHIIDNRPQLIADVLTALRAFILHGKAEAKPTISRFPEWGELIGNALLWYGYKDPTRGGDAIRAADPVKEAMRSVLSAWLHNFKLDIITAASMLSSPPCRAALCDATKVRPADISSHTAGRYLNKMVGVGLDLPHTVEAVPTRHGRPARWRLVMTERARRENDAFIKECEDAEMMG